MVRLYTVYGISTDKEPTVSTRGENSYPENELFHDIAAIEIRSYGDNPSNAFIKIVGTNSQTCITKWKRCADMFTNQRLALWSS